MVNRGTEKDSRGDEEMEKNMWSSHEDQKNWIDWEESERSSYSLNEDVVCFDRSFSWKTGRGQDRDEWLEMTIDDTKKNGWGEEEMEGSMRSNQGSSWPVELNTQSINKNLRSLDIN